jgi:pseudouridine-5'-phosphate glycosidase
MTPTLKRSPTVAAALRSGQPVVALESTLIAHGLPWPTNWETAQAAEAAVTAEGAVPATVAVWHGTPTIGLDAAQIEYLARTQDVRKASRRDLGAAIAQRACAATTVSATMTLAHAAGIRVFATGGIGGVHRRREGTPADISADLSELARTPLAVVCAGAKTILDLPATLEALETLSVPVLGYRTAEFPAFYLAASGLPVSSRVDSPAEAAAVLQAHWTLGGAGAVVAQPLPPEEALNPQEFADALRIAEVDAARQGVGGQALTPFLLRRLAEITAGRTLRANQTLVLANARLAARLAQALAGGP